MADESGLTREKVEASIDKALSPVRRGPDGRLGGHLPPGSYHMADDSRLELREDGTLYRHSWKPTPTRTEKTSTPEEWAEFQRMEEFQPSGVGLVTELKGSEYDRIIDALLRGEHKGFEYGNGPLTSDDLPPDSKVPANRTFSAYMDSVGVVNKRAATPASPSMGDRVERDDPRNKTK